jgi:hypothetical protein
VTVYLLRTSSQGFRTPDPRAGSIDAEFAAFTAGPQLQPLQFQQQQQPLIPQHGFENRISGTPLPIPNVVAEPRWAADFQKLHLGQGPDRPRFVGQSQHDVSMQQPNIESDVSGWHEDFAIIQQGLTTGGPLGGQAMTSPVFAPFAGQGYLHEQSVSPFPVAHQQAGQNLGLDQTAGGFGQDRQVGQADSAAFEEAFARAENEQVMQAKEISDSNVKPDAFNTSQERDLSQPEIGFFQQTSAIENTSIRIGSDNITPSDHTTLKTPGDNHEGQSEQTRKKQEDDSLLAQTAGQLLTSVSHEPSSKFAGSQFLGLMRLIRDREVEVSGEDFLPTKQDEGVNLDNTAMSTAPLPEDFQYQLYLPRKQDMRSFRKAKAESLRRDTEQELHPGGRSYPYSAGEESEPTMQSEGPGEEVTRNRRPGHLDERHQYDHWASGGLGIGPSEDNDPMTIREYYSIPSIKRARERAAEERLER